MEAMEIDKIIPSLENVVLNFNSKMQEKDVKQRIEAMETLSIVASAFEQEKARIELVPYLSNIINNQEDQVQIILAEQLGKMLQYIGGPDYAHDLLSILEELCSKEGNLLIEKASDSIFQIATQLSEDQLLNNIIPLIKNLYEKDLFGSKSSAANLLPKISLLFHKQDKEINNELIVIFTKLLNDDTNPNIRLITAQQVPAMIYLLPKSKLTTTAIDWLKTISKDELDTIRAISVDVLVLLTKEKEDIVAVQHLTPIFRKLLLSDSSQVVEYTIASRFVELSKLFWCDTAMKTTLITYFKVYIADPEIQIIIINQIPKFLHLLAEKNENIEEDDVISYIMNLTKQTSKNVRIPLALEISEMTCYLGKERILQIFIQFLSDESPEVNLNLISTFNKFDKSIFEDNQELSTCLVSVIIKLTRENQWRTRSQAIYYLSTVIKLCGKHIFTDQLLELCLECLCDKISSVRQAAALNLEILSSILGATWIKKDLIHRVIKVAEKKDKYLHRLAALFTLTSISGSLEPDDIEEYIIPIIIKLASDPVPNIRFNVAKSLESLVYTSSHKLLISTLYTLAKDPDNDVAFFANKALETNKTINARL